MTVDFAWKECPACRVASIVRVGPWREDNLRTEFGELVRWAERQGVRTKRWIFLERGHHRWEACLEVVGPAKAEGRIRLRSLRRSRVAAVVFDPDRLSSRIVYHALNDWTRELRRSGAIKAVTATREVYASDPWKGPAAWSRCEVQYLVRR